MKISAGTFFSCVCLLCCLCVRALHVTIQEQSSPNSRHTRRHWSGEKLISFGESRSKVDQDIGQSSIIHHCEMTIFRTVFVSTSWSCCGSFLYVMTSLAAGKK